MTQKPSEDRWRDRAFRILEQLDELDKKFARKELEEFLELGRKMMNEMLTKYPEFKRQYEALMTIIADEELFEAWLKPEMERFPDDESIQAYIASLSESEPD
jgi:hypothetical protein